MEVQNLHMIHFHEKYCLVIISKLNRLQNQ